MRFSWVMSVALLISPLVHASDVEVEAGLEYFVWEEFADSGRKYLDETGPRYFVGVVGTNRVTPDWAIDFGGRVYSGTVDYDGETQDGIPVTTETDYNGYRVELGFTHYTESRRSLNTGEWLIRFSMGLDYWRRSLQDTRLSDGSPVSGYVERYQVNYATLGADYTVEDSWSLGFGAKWPFRVSEDVSDYPSVSDLTLHPEGRLSLFAGAEFTIAPQLDVSIGYDSYRFAKSDEVEQDGYIFHQPESTQDTLGASLQYRF